MPSTIRARPTVRLAGVATVIAAAALLPTGCAPAQESTATSSAPSMVNNRLNPTTLSQTADAVAKQGLPVTNRSDATGALCASAGCASALSTDQFTLLQFATTGSAEIYAGDNLDGFQMLDIVVTFPDGAPAAERTRYQSAIQRALS